MKENAPILDACCGARLKPKYALHRWDMPLTPEEEKTLYCDCKDGQEERRARRAYQRKINKQKHINHE